jgi:DNA-directed RNA polymerase subunit RPC12/RpoP
MKDILKERGCFSIDGRRIVGFVGVLDNDAPSKCLDCGHTGKTHAEYEIEGVTEGEVVCPECGSLHYYMEESK